MAAAFSQASVPNPRRRAVLGLLAATPLLAACGGGSDPLASSTPTTAAASGASSSSAGGSGSVTVGSANFAESEIIGELYAQVLEAKGITVERKMQIGAREVYLSALEDGSIDLIGEYTGNLLGFYDKEATATSPQEVADALRAALPQGLVMLEPAEAQDKDSYNVTAEFSQEHGLTSLDQLKDYDGTLRIGGLPELAQRDYGAGLSALTEVYGVPEDAMEFTAISDGGGPLTVRALADGDVDLANIFSTTPAIKDNGFVTLEDPSGMITPQNVVPIMAQDKATDPVKEAVNAVQAELTTEDLMAMNAQNSGAEKKQPSEVAAAWLKEKGLV
ncbi:ABC transporter substrate-binding protein [Micrococcus sp. 2A]|uniref:ABC transporter substrate-binding protein n=1 Tax=Micrococcus TaxID=1269 RepID=UPI002004F565|nr:MULTISPECIES: ABC transporter substrate-binding protein [unclassified Micrococcus]MCK6095108.1 ABC transporter substrate-binding protein [Micrococcus sp. EYE_212]MCK6171055.1 ABC transporter substrate-binding protein [Micrococcus sp. EYE_162]